VPTLAALGAAMLFGVEDVSGALAARRTSALSVMLGLQVVGLALLLPALLIVPSVVSPAALLIGAGVGCAGSIALVVYLRAMAIGPMGIVSSLAALTGAGVPVLWGVARGGEVLTDRQAAGVVAGLAAVVLVAWRPGDGFTRKDLAGPLAALTAGLGFAAFFIGLDATPDDSGLWPLISGRTASLIVGVPLLALLSRPRPPRDALPLILVAGFAGTSASASFLVATRTGLLSLATILSSLYPVVSIVIARRYLGERLRRTQALGVTVALGAIALIVTT
jgi:drug/metabolite transporter (DMT)-like permease